VAADRLEGAGQALAQSVDDPMEESCLVTDRLVGSSALSAERLLGLRSGALGGIRAQGDLLQNWALPRGHLHSRPHQRLRQLM